MKVKTIMTNYNVQDADVILDGNHPYHPKRTHEALRQLVEAVRWRTEYLGAGEDLTPDELVAFDDADALLKETTNLNEG
jgi:hypothetical protein